MSRLTILNAAEQTQFDQPPQFSIIERKRAFELPSTVWSTAAEIRSVPAKVGFLVSAGYFKSARRFYSASDFHDSDVAYVAARLEIDASLFEHTAYPARTKQRHRLLILELAGFRPFDAKAADWPATELQAMSRSHLRPELMFWRSVDLLAARKVEVPTAFRLSEAVTQALQHRRQALVKLIDGAITGEVIQLFSNMFLRDDDVPRSPYQLTLLKRLSQSTKPAKIRERLVDHGVLDELYGKIEPVLRLRREITASY
jgi:hypothetical protein